MINLHHIDCMEFMRGLPDKAYDLAIVDPPYGIGAEGGTGDYAKAAVDRSKKWDRAPGPEYFTELFRVSQRQLIWGGNYFSLPPSRGGVCWYKTDEVKGRDFSEFELAWGSENEPARHVSMTPFQRGGTRIHPTQKPVALYRWLLQNYAKPGQKILDTHGGSMSIAIACDIEGFDLDLCELDKDYFDAGKKRLEAHQAMPRLFDAPKAEPVQLAIEAA